MQSKMQVYCRIEKLIKFKNKGTSSKNRIKVYVGTVEYKEYAKTQKRRKNTV